MQEIVLTVPRLYADHHVQKVRQVLLELPGVESVWASAAERQVAITFDPDKVDAARLTAALAEAGYEQGDVEPEMAVLQMESTVWQRAAVRLARTHPVDRQVAGDFRKY